MFIQLILLYLVESTCIHFVEDWVPLVQSDKWLIGLSRRWPIHFWVLLYVSCLNHLVWHSNFLSTPLYVTKFNLEESLTTHYSLDWSHCTWWGVLASILLNTGSILSLVTTCWFQNISGSHWVTHALVIMTDTQDFPDTQFGAYFKVAPIVHKLSNTYETPNAESKTYSLQSYQRGWPHPTFWGFC